MHLRRTTVWLALAAALAGCAAPASRSAAVQPYTSALATAVEPVSYPYTAVHGRRLAFVAAEHSVDPDGATHRAVREAFARLRPAAVIIEGIPSAWGENPADIVALARRTADPEAEAYARGEAGYAASLALAAGVPFQGGEPTEAAQTAALIVQGFDPIDILFADVLKLLPQSIRNGEISGPADPRFERVFRRWVISLAAERADPPRVNLDDFARWYQAEFGTDHRTDPAFTAHANPALETTVGRILRAQSLLRDRHLLDVILGVARRRGRVLVVYGGSHRTTLAGPLNAAFGPAEVVPGALPAVAAASSSGVSGR